MQPWPADFRDFLKLLNSHRVEYLLVGSSDLGKSSHLGEEQSQVHF